MLTTQIIERRKMIKNLMLGSGLILYPRLLLASRNEQQVQLIIIGRPSHGFVEEFMTKHPNVNCTSIGSDIGNSTIEYDFADMIKQLEATNTKSVKIPEEIKKIFFTQNKYVIISNLTKPYARLSKLIIVYLQRNSMDFRFLGTTPIFHPSLDRWGKAYFESLNDDSRLTIFDVNGYLNQLKQINIEIPAVDAFNMLEDELMGVLIGMFKY